MLGVFPVSMLASGIGSNVTLISTADEMHFGAIAGAALMPDLQQLEPLCVRALADLVKAAKSWQALTRCRCGGCGRVKVVPAKAPTTARRMIDDRTPIDLRRVSAKSHRRCAKGCVAGSRAGAIDDGATVSDARSNPGSRLPAARRLRICPCPAVDRDRARSALRRSNRRLCRDRDRVAARPRRA